MPETNIFTMGVNFMSDTLYIQTEENVEVHHPHVYLQDIAKLSCTNSKILNHLRVLPVANLDPDKTGRYVISVMDLINDIQLKEPDLDITHIGEPNFIITYQGRNCQYCYKMVQSHICLPRHLFRCRLFHYDL